MSYTVCAILLVHVSAADDECLKLAAERSSKESAKVSLQTELEVLMQEIEKLNKRLECLREEEIAASYAMEVCPDQVKELEGKLNAYFELYES